MTALPFDLDGDVLPLLRQLALPAAVIVVLAVLLVVRLLRRRKQVREDDGLPLLIVPREGTSREGIRPAPLPESLPAAEPGAAAASPAPEPEAFSSFLPPMPVVPGHPPPPSVPTAAAAPVGWPPAGGHPAGDLIGAGTVQLLPGRLEVLRGMERGREFRFVRAAGKPVTEVTLGRATGPAHAHVHLPLATVSRMHARLRYQEGRWSITNLSLTNPVRVNEHELSGPDTSHALEDGDRIRIGEVELCFWEEG